MAFIAHKYGGTLMGSVERIKNVAKRIAKQHRVGHQIMVVLSAMLGETNRLPGMAKKISTQSDPCKLDMITSTGRQVSVGLLAIVLHAEGTDARSYTGWQVPVKTDFVYAKARIQSISDERVRADLDAGRVIVITGSQGIDNEGHITTLGHGGSDTSAVAAAAALGAEECLIHTDADGIYTTDPRVVDDVRHLDKITFEETLEMVSLSPKVLQIRSVEFAGKHRVKTRVLPSPTDLLMPLDVETNPGMLVTPEENSNMEAVAIPGIAFARGEAKVIVIGVPDKPGIAYQILGSAADANIDVDMIIQNQSVEGRTDFTFIVLRDEYQCVLAILNDSVKAHIGVASVSGDPKVSKVSVVGVSMRSRAGIASKMSRTLPGEGTNIQMIFTSEIKISMLVDERYMELAVYALHKAFELSRV